MMAASLYQLLNEAYESYNVDDSCQKPSFHEFKQQKKEEQPQFRFWIQVLELELDFSSMCDLSMKAILNSTFRCWGSWFHGFSAWGTCTMLAGYLCISGICCSYKKEMLMSIGNS